MPNETIICLYGTKDGAGFLAHYNGTFVGDGKPVAHRSFTEAVWLAGDELRTLGAEGSVTIFIPDGTKRARASLEALPTFGELSWTPTPSARTALAAD